MHLLADSRRGVFKVGYLRLLADRTVELAYRIPYRARYIVSTILKKTNLSLTEEVLAFPKHSAAFVAAMEDVLEVYSRPYDEDYPLFAWMKSRFSFLPTPQRIPPKKDGVQYEDYQYIRNGTASIFFY